MGEPCECEQEVVNSVVTAGCTNGTAQSANPPELDADVDRTAMVACGVNEGAKADADVDRMALLGGKPAERASGVNEGDETEHRCQT